MEKINDKFKSYKSAIDGDLAFLNDYTYFVDDDDNYEKETTHANSEGRYCGTHNALRHGATFRNKYNSIFNPDKPLPVFTANYDRITLTAEYFIRGFSGENYNENNGEYTVIDEDVRL